MIRIFMSITEKPSSDYMSKGVPPASLAALGSFLSSIAASPTDIRTEIAGILLEIRVGSNVPRA